MRGSSLARVTLLASSWLAVAAPAPADPTLNVDGRSISTETTPPLSMPPDSAVPAAFDPFDELVTQGGSQSCPQIPANASSGADQDSTVDPFAYAGTGSASYSITAGSCQNANVNQWSVYEVTFTTDTDYVFDLEADLVNASLLLERDGGPTYVSVTDFTGPVTFQQSLPGHHYTIRVEVAFDDFASSPGSTQSDSGSYDFFLPEPSTPLGLLWGLAGLALSRRVRR